MAGTVKSLENNFQLLILDTGGAFPIKEKDFDLKTDIVLKSFDYMGYHALNLGPVEISKGIDYLKSKRKGRIFPFICSNIVDKSGNIPEGIRSHVVVVKNGVKIALLGIIPENTINQLDHPELLEGVQILPPEKALKDLLPRMRKMADIVILMTTYDWEKTKNLKKRLRGIDLALSCNIDNERPYDQTTGRVVTCEKEGLFFNLIDLTVQDDGQVALGQNRLVKLNDPALADKGIDKIIKKEYKAYFAARNAEKRVRSKQWQKEHKERLKDLSMSPEEFFKNHPEYLKKKDKKEKKDEKDDK